MKSEKKFISAREVAEILGVCRATVYRHVRIGTNFPFPAHRKLGSGPKARIIFPVESVHDYVDEWKKRREEEDWGEDDE